MALKAAYDTEQEIPQDLAAHFKKGEDGKFRPEVEGVGGWALEDVAGLKSALGKQTDRAERAEGDLRKYEGLDPAVAREALKKVEELANFKPEEKIAEGIKVREAQLVQKHQEEVQRFQSVNDRLAVQVRELLVDHMATQAILSEGGDPEVLAPHVKARIRLDRQEDGTFKRVVLDAQGNPGIADAKGAPMEPEHVVHELKTRPNFAAAFKGSGNSGAGSQSQPGTGGNGSFTLSATEAKNPQVYQAVKAQAEKAGQTVTITEA